MILKNIKHRLKLYLINFKVMRKYDVLIEKGVTIKYWESISFGEKCTVQSGAYIYGSRTGQRVEIGNHVVVAASCMILGEGGLVVGDYTHLGPHVIVTTQYGEDRTDRSSAEQKMKFRPVKIGKGCLVGSGSVIMPNSVLGDSCTVAPNSVVYGAWEDNAKLMGNPARHI